jgi:hypothetical protein
MISLNCSTAGTNAASERTLSACSANTADTAWYILNLLFCLLFMMITFYVNSSWSISPGGDVVAPSLHRRRVGRPTHSLIRSIGRRPRGWRRLLSHAAAEKSEVRGSMTARGRQNFDLRAGDAAQIN